MGLFFYTKIGSIIFIGDLPTTNIIEPIMQSQTLSGFFEVLIKIYSLRCLNSRLTGYFVIEYNCV